MDDVNKKIKTNIDSNDIVLFMKGTPEAPQCGFSMAVSNILKHFKVKFKGIKLLNRLKPPVLINICGSSTNPKYLYEFILFYLKMF